MSGSQTALGPTCVTLPRRSELVGSKRCLKCPGQGLTYIGALGAKESSEFLYFLRACV